jgi:hypothetical protein
MGSFNLYVESPNAFVFPMTSFVYMFNSHFHHSKNLSLLDRTLNLLQCLESKWSQRHLSLSLRTWAGKEGKAFRKVGLLSSGKVKMQLSYDISSRRAKRGNGRSEYSEVYCIVKSRARQKERETVGCDQERCLRPFSATGRRWALVGDLALLLEARFIGSHFAVNLTCNTFLVLSRSE